VTLWPLSQGEIDGVEERFAERLLTDPATLVTGTASSTSREEYAERILRGGFPLAAARRSGAGRNRWFDDYLNLVIERDVAELSSIRQREKMPGLLVRLGGQTAQVLNVARVAADTGIEASTAEHYVRLLEAAFVLHRLPAWGTTLRVRASSKPKVHFVDSGVAGRMLRVNASRLSAAEPQAMTQLGHLLETFCVAETLKQVGWMVACASSAKRSAPGFSAVLCCTSAAARIPTTIASTQSPSIASGWRADSEGAIAPTIDLRALAPLV
jgi:uncharacterized protein